MTRGEAAHERRDFDSVSPCLVIVYRLRTPCGKQLPVTKFRLNHRVTVGWAGMANLRYEAQNPKPIPIDGPLKWKSYFFGYFFNYSLPILIPTFFLIGWLFFKG